MLKQAHPKEQELSLRNKIETSLDIIMLRYLKGQLPIEFDMKQIFPKDEAVQLEVASLYCYLLDSLFDEKQELSVLLQATEDARKTCGMLNDRSTLKKAFLNVWNAAKSIKDVYPVISEVSMKMMLTIMPIRIMPSGNGR